MIIMMSVNEKEKLTEHDRRIVEELLCDLVPSGVIYGTRLHAAMNRLAATVSNAEPLTDEEQKDAS